MITNALIITVLGMGTVFIFLILMVAAMNATKAALPLLERLAPEEVAPAPAAPAAASGNTGAAVAAAIAAAYAASGKEL
jgi:sodium pump decarboxylase gamma subunit